MQKKKHRVYMFMSSLEHELKSEVIFICKKIAVNLVHIFVKE